MILTGRAKDDFLSWYGTGEHYFTTTLNPIEQYANIFEWLDGIGLHVQISMGYFSGYLYYADLYYENRGVNPNITTSHETRQQATEAAIKLASQIYNNENKI